MSRTATLVLDPGTPNERELTLRGRLVDMAEMLGNDQEFLLAKREGQVQMDLAGRKTVYAFREPRGVRAES